MLNLNHRTTQSFIIMIHMDISNMTQALEYDKNYDILLKASARTRFESPGILKSSIIWQKHKIKKIVEIFLYKELAGTRGVPQGTILGSPHFTLYDKDILVNTVERLDNNIFKICPVTILRNWVFIILQCTMLCNYN